MLAARIGYDVTQFTVTESAREFLFWGWFLLVLTLPAALLAWTEKPLDDDEAFEAVRH
jgi:membrane-associated PAP2 superfamily phosphatase